MSVFCAHFFYRLVNLAYDPPAFAELFAPWQNGHMLYGGLIGSLLALWCCGGKRALRLMDAYAPSMALMIAAFRLSEGFAGQGYGQYVYEGTASVPLSLYDVRSLPYELWAWALFMAEALVALVLFAALLCRKDRRHGDGILLLLGLFAAAQIVLESLRRDEFLRWGFVRCEELFSALTVGAVLFGYQRLSKKGKALQKSLCWVLFGVLVAFCPSCLEFATEGRIPFLRFLDVEGLLWLHGRCLRWSHGLCAMDAFAGFGTGEARREEWTTRSSSRLSAAGALCAAWLFTGGKRRAAPLGTCYLLRYFL